MKNIEEKNKVYKKRANRYLITFLVVFVLGYAFFLSTNIFMPKGNKDINATPMMKEIKANNRIITPIALIYEPQMEEIIFFVGIKKSSADKINNYSFSAVTSDGYFAGDLLYSKDNLYVISFDVPKNYQEISIRINSEEGEFSTVKIYGFEKDIPKKSLEGNKNYIEEAAKFKIEHYEQEIEILRGKIEEEEIIIDDGEKAIEELKKGSQYKTVKEKNEDQEAINQLLQDIELANNQITSYESEIQEIELKIELGEKQMKDLKGESDD